MMLLENFINEQKVITIINYIIFDLLIMNYTPYPMYTKETMISYLETLSSLYKGWEREEGITHGNGLPWVSFQNPEGNWMHHWWLGENGKLNQWKFDPKRTVNLKITPNAPI